MEDTKQNFLVSVIIPNYNYAHLISETIDSVKSQTFPNFECIIVDDGSTDNSVEVITNWIKNDHRFILLQKTNGGLSSARNEGIKIAKGKYIAFLDSDDLWEKDKISSQLDKLKESEFDVVFSNSITFENNQTLKETIFDLRYLDVYEFLASNPIPGCASNFMVKKYVFEKIGFFDNDLRSYEDLDFLFRVSLNGFKFINVPSVSIKIRKHNGSMQTNFLKMFYNKSYALDKWLNLISNSNFVIDKFKFHSALKKRFQSMLWTARDCKRYDLVFYCYIRIAQLIGFKFYLSTVFFRNIFYDLKLFIRFYYA